jgi:hypothetical protein
MYLNENEKRRFTFEAFKMQGQLSPEIAEKLNTSLDVIRLCSECPICTQNTSQLPRKAS